MRPMKVRLLFFAVLRDITGQNELELTLAEGTRAGEVWQTLRQRHRELAAYARPPLTAINESYASADSILRDGDELAFIPPVAGG
jgi:molybdopterin synthase sulfur carrier subunit